jgi:hypothetical protein
LHCLCHFGQLVFSERLQQRHLSQGVFSLGDVRMR